jgi:DNA replication protein DnaC
MLDEEGVVWALTGGVDQLRVKIGLQRRRTRIWKHKREACLSGYRGRFYNAQVLLDELYASLADRTTTKLLAQMSRMRPLVIDELGYLTLKPEQANAFFRLMDQRYNRVSTIITTSLDLPDWYELFDKKSLVDALLDRLQHHCITIRIDGPSLRSPEPGATEPPTASSVVHNGRMTTL